MKRIKNHPRHAFRIFLGLIFFLTGTQICRSDVARTAEKNVAQSIQIGQKSQADRTRWEQEKAQLVLTYETLLQEKAQLDEQNKNLSDQEKQLQKNNQAMVQKKWELIRLQKELGPFLGAVFQQLNTLLETDPPFLKTERQVRLAKLSDILEDPGATIAEKYRKVMEALFIEAEYGSTIEVYQDKIRLSSGSEETLGNIFRLGRVSLFFLSLDQTICGTYNPGAKEWQRLPDTFLPAIQSAVEISSKRKPAELLPIPVGRLTSQGGEQ